MGNILKIYFKSTSDNAWVDLFYLLLHLKTIIVKANCLL